MCRNMNITIIVKSAPFSSQAPYTAYNFALAAIQLKHKLLMFFNHSGVLNALNSICPPEDEFNIVTAWQKLASHNSANIELLLCSSAAIRRGITTDNIATGFKIATLANLFTNDSQRVVSFG